ncbi:TetR/AcrR family transcriptional regulator [Paenibacillus sp. YSY-4.3]
MATTDHDLRVHRTRKYLKEAYIALLQEQEFYKITVHALTKRAEINRVTFYLHYQDMDDFVEQFLQELLDEIEAILRTKYDAPYEPGYELATLVTLLEYIAANAHIYKTLIVSKSIPYFTQHLMELMRKLILGRAPNTDHQAFPAMDIPKDIAAWYGTSAMVGTIALWLGEDMPYSPHYLAKQIVKLNPFRPDIR